MTEPQIEMLIAVLDIAYAVVLEDFPGLPRDPWVKEVLETFWSDQDFWRAAHPEGTLEEFMQDTLLGQGAANPLRQAAQNVMRRGIAPIS